MLTKMIIPVIIGPGNEEPKPVQQLDLSEVEEDQLDIVTSLLFVTWDLRTSYVVYQSDVVELEGKHNKAKLCRLFQEVQENDLGWVPADFQDELLKLIGLVPINGIPLIL